MNYFECSPLQVSKYCSHKIYKNINPMEPYEDMRWQKKRHYSAETFSVTVENNLIALYAEIVVHSTSSSVFVHYASRDSFRGRRT